MTYFKQVKRTIIISPSKRTNADLNIEVRSYDENVSKFIFKLTSEISAVDLAEAEVIVFLEYEKTDGTIGKIQDFGLVENVSEQEISYTLSSQMRGYEGLVDMSIYVNLANGEKIDIYGVTFNMKKSRIDSMPEDVPGYYYQGFEDIRNEILSQANDILEDVGSQLPRVEAKLADAKSAIAQIRSDIDENNVVTDEDLPANNLKVISDEAFSSSGNLNFAGKITGSVSENKNVAKTGYNASLLPPTSSNLVEFAQNAYDSLSISDGTLVTHAINTAGLRRQMLFGWNLLADVEKKHPSLFGALGCVSDAEKTAWLRQNVKNLAISLFGFGNGGGGNILYLSTFQNLSGDYAAAVEIAGNSVTELNKVFEENDMPEAISDEGFIFGLVHAPAAEASAASTINVDYAETIYTLTLKLSDVFATKNQMDGLTARVSALEG